MDLRRCTRSHFIRTIRGGLVIKVHNVDSQGKPALVFRKLKDIYETVDAKNLGMTSTIQSQDRYSDLVVDCDKVKSENPCFPLAERKTKKRIFETDKVNCHVSDVEKDSDSDDSGFGKITLNQLKEKCKTKKRKVSNLIGVVPKQDSQLKEKRKTKKRKVSNLIGVVPKQDGSDLRLEEDDFDLKEPLSCWKSKLSKSLKVKRKGTQKCVSTSDEIALSVKSEQIPTAEESMVYIGALPPSIDVKVEVPGPEDSECQNLISVAKDFFSGCNEQIGFRGDASSEILLTNKSKFETQAPMSPTEECQICVLNEVSYDHIEQVEPSSFLPPIGRMDMEKTNPETSCQQFPVLPLSELKKGYKIHPIPHESPPETTSPIEDQSSDIFDSSQSHLCSHVISSPRSTDSKDQVPDMATDSSLCWMEPSYGAEPCMFTDDIKEDLPLDNGIDSLTSHASNCSPPWKSYECLNDDDLVHSKDGSPPIDEKLSSSSANVPVTENCSSPDNNLVSMDNGSLTTEEKQPLIYVNELSSPLIKSDNHSEMWHPPERLLSTRKAISPTSQERLCQAMDSIDLKDDIDHYKYKGKLCFEKQNENKDLSVRSDIEGDDAIVSSEGPAQFNQIKGTISPKQITKRPNSDKKGSPPKGIVKGSHLPRAMPNVSTSILNSSGSAIAFSQRQLQDIEGIAMKLMKELKSMKDIVEENLNSEAYPSTPLKYEEVKTAIKNATKAEETSRKWLTIMARDCNRFCKIMRLSEKGSAAPENAIQKERKKITFADEAGGMLCHVKFFEDGMASSEFESEKQKLQVQ